MRKRAERARGLALISASVAVTPCGESRRSVGTVSPTSGRWREPFGLRPACLAHEMLHAAVFQRMERDDRHAPTRRQHRFGGFKAAVDLAQLVIDGDAQGLEGAGRRVDPVRAAGPHGAAHDLGQAPRGGDRRQGARRDDRLGNARAPAFLAECEDEIGQAAAPPSC